MTHTELCGCMNGRACDCGVVEDAIRSAEQQIEETLAVMDMAVDPCFDELFEALEAIQKARES